MNLANSVGPCSHSQATGRWRGCGVTRGPTGEGEFHFHTHTRGSRQDYIPQGLRSPLALSHLSRGPLHRAAAGFIGSGKPESLYNLRSDVLSLLRFPFTRGESQAPSRSGVTPGYDHQPVGLLGHLEVPTQRAGGELERSCWLLHQSEPEPDMATVWSREDMVRHGCLWILCEGAENRVFGL